MSNNFIHQEITPNCNLPFRIILHHHPNLKHQVVRHWHRSLEISYIISGQIEDFYLDGKHYSPEAGDIMIVNPHSIHGITSEKDPEKFALTLMFPKSFFIDNKIHRYYFLNPLNIKMNTDQEIAYHQLQQLFSELSALIKSSNTVVSRLKIISLVYDILHQLVEYFSETRAINTPLTTLKHFKYLEEIIEYIENHYSKSLSVSLLAEALHLSEGYLSRTFKKYMNMSIMKYVTHFRLLKAHQLVLNSNYTIEEIITLTGFPNRKSFTKQFKTTYSLPPHQYRLAYHQSTKKTIDSNHPKNKLNTAN